MHLLAQINEASDLPVDKVVAAIRKDKRVSQIFTLKLQPDDIPNQKEFFATLRYYFFNNKNVAAYASAKNASPYFSKPEFVHLRNLLTKALDKSNGSEMDTAGNDYLLDSIRLLILGLDKELEKDEKPQQRSGLDAILQDWNSSVRVGRTHNLIAGQLFNFPSLRPKTPQVLYKAVVFSEGDMLEQPDYSGKMNIGNGLKFLRSIRDGKDIVDVKLQNPSAWATTIETAMKSATETVTLNGGERKVKAKQFISFIISCRIQPDSIVFMTDRLPEKFQAAQMFINTDAFVKSGEYTCRVLKRFSPKGEETIHPDTSETDFNMEVLKDVLELFRDIIDIPLDIKPENVEHLFFNFPSQIPVSTFKELLKEKVTKKLNDEVDKIIAVFNSQLKNLDDDELKAASTTKMAKTVGVARELISDL